MNRMDGMNDGKLRKVFYAYKCSKLESYFLRQFYRVLF